MRTFLATARLELAETLRSRWLLFAIAVYAVLAGVFVLVGMRESTVIGFTGMGRVLLAFSHALVLLLPLLGLLATGQVVNRARDEGALELWFSHPVRRGSWFAAVSAVRLAVLAVPLVLLMPLLALFGWIAFGQGVEWGFLLRSLLASTALLTAAVATGLAVSVFVRSQTRALTAVLLVWALGVALVDFALIGLMLQWRLPPEAVFALAALNPVQDARLALLSAAQPELATLGPVGFFLSERIGSGGLLLLGVGWPLLLAGTLWVLALHRFRAGDLV